MDLHITVKSALPIGDPQGEFPVLASENMTMGMLLRTVCKDNGIRMKSSYTMKNSSQQELRWSSTLRENMVMSGAILYLHDNEDGVEVRSLQCNVWWYLGFISMIIGAVGLITICVLHYKDGLPYYSTKRDNSKIFSDLFQYGIVMDAGSSHTKMFIYKWDGDKYQNTALAHQVHLCSVKGAGISSYELDPSQLAPPLRVCLEEAKTVIPTDKHKDTPIFLGATAGMRLISEVNSSSSEAILAVVRNTIAECKFNFSVPDRQARIISGAEEGLFSWITSNYISGQFGVKVPNEMKSSNKWLLGATGEGTVGAMDLGGASTQLTYFAGEGVQMPSDYSSSAVLYGSNYSVYTHSYLCYGINEITRKFKALLVKNQNYSTVINNPCSPSGVNTTETYQEVFEAPCTKDSHGGSAVDKVALLGDRNIVCHVGTAWNVGPRCARRSVPIPWNGAFHYQKQPEQPDRFCKWNAPQLTLLYSRNRPISSFTQNTTYIFEGSSNYTECSDTVSQLFNFSAPCPYGDHCSFNGTYQPPVMGNFYAFSNYFYEASFLNLTTNKSYTTLKEYETAISTLCRKPWSEVKTMKADPEFLPWYCFRGSYILILLRDAYKFTDDTFQNINFINTLNGTEIGWSLGFMIASSSYSAPDIKDLFFSTASFVLLVILFVVFIIIAVGFGIFARRYHVMKKKGMYNKLPGYGAI
ncbi:hypothetical protein FSP39_009462 [Pinctada imbricata]|uniref:Uncharacterized protein n=1 Tax=Pinctada imbricata TaxID=66713 RepID=A0AA88Y626_PINIB|nr:hypothetical protein FSP39_009462 [Pinctada imbricata]